jgi:hypothetical protein
MEANRAFQRQMDRVCTLILFEYPECEIEGARSEAERLFPDKTQLFEITYESRFRRRDGCVSIWEQFCKEGDLR